MNKTQIEWVKNPDGSQGYTWNPITGCLNHDNGLCKGGGFPCYAYKLANGRLKERYLDNTTLANDNSTPFALCDPFYPRFWEERVLDLTTHRIRHHTRERRGIFVCDMGDLFDSSIPEKWTERVFDAIKSKPHDRFYLLTKQPQNLIQWSPFPENCYVGVTATNAKMADDAGYYFQRIDAEVRFLSLEPLLEPMQLFFSNLVFNKLDWLIIGACTGSYVDIARLSKRYPDLDWRDNANFTKFVALPKIEWVREIVEAADKAEIPVFLKDNLKPLIKWPQDGPWPFKSLSNMLRQEMPKGER